MAQLELHLPAKAEPLSVQGFSCFADQAVLGALLAVEKPLRASECARCAPCPAPALLLHRRSWLLPPARVRLARFGCVTCIMATLSLCFPQAQEQVCGKVSVLTSTLHGALEYYVRALRCVPLGCRRGFLHAHFPAMRCMQILQLWGTCGAVPPLPVAMHFKPLAEPSSSAFEHLLSMAACWCRDRWNWNTPCPGRSHLQD